MIHWNFLFSYIRIGSHVQVTIMAKPEAFNIATSLVGKILKRALRTTFLAKAGVSSVSFDTTMAKTWVESPDIGRKGSFTAGEIAPSVAQGAVGAKFPGNGKDRDFRVGGEIVIIPKEEKYKYDICVIDGENFTFEQRSIILSTAVMAIMKSSSEASPQSLDVVPFNWDAFMEVVNKYSHPEKPGEWTAYVAKIYGWVRGGSRASMKGGIWTPAPPRPDESIPDDEKCEVVMAALSALDEAHGRGAKYRTPKKSAASWNRGGAMWEREELKTPKTPKTIEPVVAIRPPTFMRAASRYHICEDNCSSEAATYDEDHRAQDKKDLVYIMD